MKHIVIINTEFTNSRKTCENIENQSFESREELLEYIRKNTDCTEEELKQEIHILEMSDFMDAVNDQVLDNLENSFISYVDIC